MYCKSTTRYEDQLWQMKADTVPGGLGLLCKGGVPVCGAPVNTTVLGGRAGGWLCSLTGSAATGADGFFSCDCSSCVS